MQRDELVAYLDAYLQTGVIEDASNNGLQVEGVDDVDRLALAVDAGLAAFEAAHAAGAQMMVVHHGLFWSTPVMVTGPHRHRLALLLEAGISLYAAHLPLDFHQEVGNNVTISRWLELQDPRSFGAHRGHPVGVMGYLPQACSLDSFAAKVDQALGEQVVQIWPFGRETVQQVAVASGGSGTLVDQAAAAGLDVFLTGEMSHAAYHQARELGMNVVFAGHYATETAGLKALAGHLTDHFGLDCVFLDLPTGA